jgi:serine/threonine protein kinase
MNDHRLALPVGTMLNQYQIESILGYGGFGIVYKARHSHLDDLVAIKEFLPQEIATREGTSVHPLGTKEQGDYDEGMQRFLAEAKQLVQFRKHPNIVSCTDFFEANGTAYLVMEFENGMPLSDLLRARQERGEALSEEQILSIIVPLLDGLKTIHDAGVLHRDIKPGNIFIRRSDEQPVLIDFGAAKQNFSQHSKSMAPYSPGYAAIEQVEEAGNLGPWTDLYAIGAIIWRILMGQNPVPVESRLTAVVRSKPDPMAALSEQSFDGFRQEFLQAVDRCLKLDESERFQSAAQLLQALMPQEKPEPAKTQPNTEQVQLESQSNPKPQKSKAPLLWTTALAAVFIVVGALSYLFLRNQGPPTPTKSTLFVQTSPEWATKMIGFVEMAESKEMEFGEYTLSVSAPGYLSQDLRIYLEDDIEFVRVDLNKDPELSREEFLKFQGEELLRSNRKRAGVIETATGLQYEVLKKSIGPRPKTTTTVEVHYRGMLANGEEFDSSSERGPSKFKVNQLIAAWVEILPLMPLGSRYRIVVPPHLGYGSRGAGSIPADAVLVFELELLSMEDTVN